ncbi:MAG TPA: ABC transporter permease [Vicinamibacterales bacterium]|nr:ABC transporter permease [Vicinamibacterales bacterium]
MTSFFRKFTWWRQRRRREDELCEELQFHMAEEAGERQADGLSEDEARSAARRDLGNVLVLREDTRTLWSWILLEQLAQDIRYGLRTMIANKTFSAMAILSLALGIGANTAIFSVMDSILLRSLPVPDPQSLVILSWHTPQRDMHGTNRHDNSFMDPNGGFVGGFFAYPAFELFRRNDSVFSTVFGYQGAGDLNLTFQGQAGLARTEYVSSDYFRGLGIPPAAGRLIGADDDRAGAPGTAVVSFALSRKRFGGPENAAGQSIRINNIPFTVVGVAPSEFFGADPDRPPDVYVPMHANLLLEPRNYSAATYLDPYEDWVVPMARLRPGVSAKQAQAALAGPFFEWARTADPKRLPEDVPTLVVREGSGGLDGLRRTYSKPLYILLTLVALILSIACANIANLLLARAAARKREIALRLSLGAGRLRIIRQLLTESVLLAVLGGVLGVVFTVWGIQFLTLLLANGRDNFTLRAELNWSVLVLAAGLSLLTGVLFGLAPALQATRTDVVPALKESRIGKARGRGFGGLGLSRILMVSQIAFTLLILVAAGLFVRTLSNLASIPLGFNRENVLTFQLNARQAGHDDPEIVAFYDDLRRQFTAIPGIRAASLSNHSLIGTGTSGTGVSVSGAAPEDSSILTVGAGFFTTMQIPLLRGREIDERDAHGSPMVAVVNEAFARRSFGDRNALGQHLTLERMCPKCDIEIVGVSANTLYGNLKGQMPPTVYLPFAQGGWGPLQGMVYELRTSGNSLNYVHAVRDLVQRADPHLPLSNVKSQSAWIDQTISQEIAFARLCTAFAVLALAIACVGLYGTVSYNVARRTGEIGIRMALGAQRSRVLWMVLREVVLLAAAGVAISVPAALAASKLVESFLFGMKPTDPRALAGAVATLVSAAMLAGYLPARNASRIDPMIALRHD